MSATKEVNRVAERTATPKARPLGDRVLVLPSKAADRTPGGLFLPDNAKDKPQKGEVLAVGPGKLREDGGRTPVAVKVGDTVLYSQWAGSNCRELGEALVLREDDILAVLE